jgi:hypothetical protein
MDDIHLFEAIYSARSIRKLSADPVPDALITRVLESATQALRLRTGGERRG